MDDFMNKMQIIPNGPELIVRSGNAPKPIDPYVYNGFTYSAFSTPSLIALAKEKAVKENAIIFADDKGFTVICDDTVKDRDQDTIRMDFCLSTTAKEWRRILTEDGQTFNIKNLVDFLKRRDPVEVDNIDELLYSIKNFRYVKNISGDFTYDDRNNYNFAVKINNTDTTVRIPALILANIEIFKSSGFVSAIDIEIEVEQPDNAGEPPLIQLSCPTFLRHYGKAKEVELETLKKELPGWLIVEGSK